jgi:hypothetical protein
MGLFDRLREGFGGVVGDDETQPIQTISDKQPAAQTPGTAAAAPAEAPKDDTSLSTKLLEPTPSTGPTTPIPTDSAIQQQMHLRDLIKKPSPIDYSGLDLAQKNLQDAIQKKDTTKTAGEIQSLLNQTRADAIKAAQTSPEYTQYADTLKNIQQQLADTKQEAKDQEAKIGWLAAAESIGQALTQYAAARYGLQHGVNLGGLKMEKADWEKLLAQSQHRLQQEVNNLQDFRKEVTKQQAGVVSDFADTSKQAVQGQLQSEKESLQSGVKAAEAGLQGEERKAQLKLAEEGLKVKSDYDEALANARMASAQGHPKSAPEFKKLQAVTLQESKDEQKKITQAQKALSLLSGIAGEYDAATKKKDKDKIVARLSAQLSAQGLSPDIITKTTGFFSNSVNVDSEELHKQIAKQQAILSDRSDQLHDYSTNLATADSVEGIQALRNQRKGGVSAEPAKKEAAEPAKKEVAGQAPSPGGKITVRVKGTQQYGLIDPGEFDPATLEKVD